MKTIYVSKTRPGCFSTLREAVLSVADDRDEPVRIEIAPGVYEEKLFIRKENLEICAQEGGSVLFRCGDGAKKPRPDGSGPYGTFNTAVLFLAGKDITVKNIAFENTAGCGAAVGQALALFCAADRCSFLGCRFIGYQDTIFAGDAADSEMKRLMLPAYFKNSTVPMDYPVIRNYFKDCYICGDVDFIFGPNTAFFENCEIHSRKRKSEEKAFITAASTPPGQEFGFVFSGCRLTGEDEEKSVYLGRPWRDFAKTAFIRCELGSHICPEGWQNWGKIRAEAVCSYIEHACTGPGACVSRRAPFAKVLMNPETASYFSRENVLSGRDDWQPPSC